MHKEKNKIINQMSLLAYLTADCRGTKIESYHNKRKKKLLENNVRHNLNIE